MGDSKARVAISPELHQVVQEVLALNGTFAFRARGYSMCPLIHPGDILQVQPVTPQELRKGDIVLFLGPQGSYVTHRLIRKVKANGRLVVLITQGDNTEAQDIPIQAQEVVGKVVAIEREGRWLRLDRGMGRLLNYAIYYFRGWSPWRPRAARGLGRYPWRCLKGLMWRKA